MCASGKGHTSIVEMLLEKGADPAALDVDGKDALKYAEEKGQFVIVNLLKKIPAP